MIRRGKLFLDENASVGMHLPLNTLAAKHKVLAHDTVGRLRCHKRLVLRSPAGIFRLPAIQSTTFLVV
jgi:hypothetical protein